MELKRTPEEIVARIRQVQKTNLLFDFEGSDLTAYLPFNFAKEFLNEDVTAEQLAEVQLANKLPSDEILGYLPFAWEKANNCRGLSAARSLQHLAAWTWLDGREDLATLCKGHYEHYGKEQLIAVSEAYNFNWKVYDNGERTNSG